MKDDVSEIIQRYQRKFDEFHDTSQDYIPPDLRKLRDYVFQTHSDYERIMFLIIQGRFFRDDIEPKECEDFMSMLTFDEKLKIVERLESSFPVEDAKHLNFIRNQFAHWRGYDLRSEFADDNKFLRKYKSLSRYYDSLDGFIVFRHGSLTKSQVEDRIYERNKKFNL